MDICIFYVQRGTPLILGARSAPIKQTKVPKFAALTLPSRNPTILSVLTVLKT